jgi:acetyltransferase-like isoleucine patch superfamily enzyme
VIEDDVMFASNVFINDASHGYENASVPFKYQPLFKINPVRIGRGSWVGQNAVILSGVTIGELSIIGANSVVTSSVPEKCIAVGNPAKVIQQWDGTQWRHIRE